MNTIRIIHKENYAILQLNRGKVNAINHEMVKEIRTAVADVATNHAVKGLILTGTPHFFTAGLDVIELYSYDREKIAEFFADFGGLFIDLVSFEKPLVAALTGYSPAGGCVMAIACDYRVMAKGEKYTIGLNEVAVNVQISKNLTDAYAFWLGSGKAHDYILNGKLLKVEEALEVGLIHEAVDLEEVLPAAQIQMQKYLSFHEDIFKNSKKHLRQNWLDTLEKDPKKSLEQAAEMWWEPEIRSRMKAFVDSLQKR
jgi:3,2-trans-enoyl-CoA isomerase